MAFDGERTNDNLGLGGEPIKKPSADSSGDGLKDRYISLLERTISSLEEKIKNLTLQKQPKI